LEEFTLSILRDVYDGSPLAQIGSCLVSESGHKYEYDGNIPVLLNTNFISGDNLKYKNMYNWMYRGYDFAEKYIGRIAYGKRIINMRRELMAKLNIKPEDKILYVSIGTGIDFTFMPEGTELSSNKIIGADISIGMLKKCEKNLRKWKIKADLINCCAEALPIANNSFDVVFHVGGINFFSDKRRAINEMIRVAKPGTKLLIADETQKLVNELYKKNPLSKRYFDDKKIWSESPASLLPDGVTDVETGIHMDNRFYSITFKKS